jgi:hypothetical protein
MINTTTTHEPQARPALNPVQLYLLKLFATIKSKETMEDIQNLVLDYYRKKIDAESDILWDKLQLDNKKMDALMYGHERAK